MTPAELATALPGLPQAEQAVLWELVETWRVESVLFLRRDENSWWQVGQWTPAGRYQRSEVRLGVDKGCKPLYDTWRTHRIVELQPGKTAAVTDPDDGPPAWWESVTAGQAGFVVGVEIPSSGGAAVDHALLCRTRAALDEESRFEMVRAVWLKVSEWANDAAVAGTALFAAVCDWTSSEGLRSSPQARKSPMSYFKKQLGECECWFQPIVNLSPFSVTIAEHEALARESLVDSARGGRLPEWLFGAADLYGGDFHAELDMYFIEKACQRYRNTTAFEMNNFGLAVNARPSTLRRETYFDRLKSAYDDGAEFKRGKFTIELSERCGLVDGATDTSGYITVVREYQQFIRTQLCEGDLRRVATDDFGVGHTSAFRVIILCSDVIKVDQQVRELEKDELKKLFSTVLELKKLGEGKISQVVVEGVDDKGAEETRRNMITSAYVDGGVRLAQGFFFGKAQFEPAIELDRAVVSATKGFLQEVMENPMLGNAK